MVEPFSSPDVVAVKGAYRTRQEDLWARLAQIEFLERYNLLESNENIDFVDTYSGAYRRNRLLETGGFRTDFRRADNEDVELSYRVKKLGGRFVFAKDAIVYHSHREGFRGYARLKFGRGFWRMKVYSEHPEKITGDSYTPLSLKLQLFLTLLIPFMLIFKSIRSIWKIGWLYSCFPLMKIAANNDPALLVWVPIFCLVRSISLTAGIIAGLTIEKGECLRHWFRLQNC
jgi:GT2 family glycosyltransferase